MLVPAPSPAAGGEGRGGGVSTESQSPPPAAGGFAVYLRPRLIAVLAMGFGSGLPLALTGATLSVRMAEAHVSLKAIGFFSLVTLSYNFKFLWAPLLDTVPVPVLTGFLGQRRAWALVIQACLMAAICGLGLGDPAASLTIVAAWAVAVAFFSASQDIVIDAYRVELLASAEQGAGAAATQMGYRLGMIFSGAGALYFASWLDWRVAYLAMAAGVLISSATILLTPEPMARRRRPGGLQSMLIAPFADFTRRRRWPIVLLFVALYFLGDAVSGRMAFPLYVALGFTKPEIASVSKVFGVVASIVGVSLGGIAVYRLGVMRALLWTGIAKLLMNFMYILLARAGHDLGVLTFTIGAENLAGGMAEAAFVAFLSMLCSPGYTATQYALLSALATFARTTLSSGSGVLAEGLGWNGFFMVAALMGVPALLLLRWIGDAAAQQKRGRGNGHQQGTDRLEPAA